MHGSAPDIAGQGIANPCALLLGAVQLSEHLEHCDAARGLRDVIRKVIGAGAGDRVAPDLGGAGTTSSFAEAIIERLGACRI